MKRHLLFLLLMTATPLLGLSPYLANPDLLIGYVDTCAHFWEGSYDPVQGGYYTNVDRQGQVITSWGTNKNMLTQTRHAYGFARAFALTGDTTFLSDMENALDFQYEHAWDESNGGWYGDLNADGSPSNPNGSKSAFNQHYALLGPAAAWEVTRSDRHWSRLMEGSANLDDVYWDDREGLEGYFDGANAAQNFAWNKSFNATVDAMTTHLIILLLNTDDPAYLTRYTEVAEQVQSHLVASMPDQAIGFVEEFNSDWGWDNGETMTIMGHVLKSAWCLARLEQLAPIENGLVDAETLVADVLDLGYDHALGGPYKDYNRITGEMLMWGNPDTAKAWWQMEQAVTAGLQLFSVTGDSTYLQMADETLDFFMEHFVDHVYGEVYENRTRYGDETWGTHKGGGGKAGYHSIELGYYGYLYGKLLVQGEPVTLHYHFETLDFERQFELTPIAMNLDDLAIACVEHNGEAYEFFDSAERTIWLDGGSGGHFTVTFTPTGPVALADEPVQQPRTLQLVGNYPNPFNGSTTIQIAGLGVEPARLTIHDLKGRRLRSYDLSPSEEKISTTWDGRDARGEDLPSGMYLYRLESAGRSLSKRMILLR